LITISNESLLNYYNSNHILMYHYHYSLHDLENMYPYEREIYIELLNNQIKEENERRKQRQK